MPNQKQYMAIDLKSFYASVECIERGLDPMTTNLVVADESRTEKTICLAVSPSLKSFGIPGRPRLFEVVQKIGALNRRRQTKTPNRIFAGQSFDYNELMEKPELSISYLTAVPRMALYMDYSTEIYRIYLKYIAPEDIHVYSIDEVLMDVTNYLQLYKMTACELAKQMVKDVLNTTGIPAAAGIGTNLYLCKVAMDIVAKRISADEDGVRIAQLDEAGYRRLLWNHKPITDFWRIGQGYAKKLQENGLYTMGDIARCSIGKPSDFYNEDLLYDLFGVNAELLIDHAWGWEPCGIEEVRSYKPESKSIGCGQVLQHPYSYEKAKLVVREMTDSLVLDLVDKNLVTDQILLTVGYDTENLRNPEIAAGYKGPVVRDPYGRRIPKGVRGSARMGRKTASVKQIMQEVMKLYERIVDKNLLVRRVNLSVNHVVDEDSIKRGPEAEQLDFFTDHQAFDMRRQEEEADLEKERRVQKAVLDIKKRYGKNAVLRGISLEDGATAKERNRQIGGHKA